MDSSARQVSHGCHQICDPGAKQTRASNVVLGMGYIGDISALVLIAEKAVWDLERRQFADTTCLRFQAEMMPPPTGDKDTCFKDTAPYCVDGDRTLDYRPGS